MHCNHGGGPRKSQVPTVGPPPAARRKHTGMGGRPVCMATISSIENHALAIAVFFGRADFALWRTFGNLWRHFGSSQWVEGGGSTLT